MGRGERKRYQLRYAAGVYWLLDMEQDGQEYRRPFSMNETGAMIWRELQAGHSRGEISELLAEYYQVPVQDTFVDVEQFAEILEAKGIRAV